MAGTVWGRLRPAVGAPARRGEHGGLPRGALWFVASAVLSGVLLTGAPAVRASSAEDLALQVNFSATGTISVTLPDGTPVGTATGSPTVIPAGFYTVLQFGPGGCTDLPYFDLQGTGASIVDNMDGGEFENFSYNAYFQPNATYTWRNDDASPPVVYTFTTSSVVEGTAPVPPSSAGIASSAHSVSPATASNVVGSALVPFRGTLSGRVSPAGALTLLYRGSRVTSLASGRYTLTVSDESPSRGFTLATGGHRRVALGAARPRPALDLGRPHPGHWLASAGARGQERVSFQVTG